MKKTENMVFRVLPDKKEKLEKKAKAIEGVKDVIEIKARYHGADLFVDLKITVNPDITVCQGHDIASVVKQELIAEYPEAREVLVHVEPADSS